MFSLSLLSVRQRQRAVRMQMLSYTIQTARRIKFYSAIPFRSVLLNIVWASHILCFVSFGLQLHIFSIAFPLFLLLLYTANSTLDVILWKLWRCWKMQTRKTKQNLSTHCIGLVRFGLVSPAGWHASWALGCAW